MGDDFKTAVTVIAGIFTVLALIILAVFGIWWASQSMTVWSSGKSGQAELARADWNRQIAVREATAQMESAKMLAQADVERAKGVAKSNKIIGQSLNKNEAYLTWLWIDSIQKTKNQIIYVPTRGGLPVLEAGRFNNLKK